MTPFEKGARAAKLELPESGCLMTGSDHRLWLQGYRSYKKQQPVGLDDCFDTQKMGDEFFNKHLKHE